MSRIAIAFDGSPSAGVALRRAGELFPGAHATVVSVAQGVGALAGASGAARAALPDEVIRTAIARLRESALPTRTSSPIRRAGTPRTQACGLSPRPSPLNDPFGRRSSTLSAQSTRTPSSAVHTAPAWRFAPSWDPSLRGWFITRSAAAQADPPARLPLTLPVGRHDAVRRAGPADSQVRVGSRGGTALRRQRITHLPPRRPSAHGAVQALCAG